VEDRANGNRTALKEATRQLSDGLNIRKDVSQVAWYECETWCLGAAREHQFALFEGSI
jgi:hypothetical protein